jgi:putative tributyrin esterase
VLYLLHGLSDDDTIWLRRTSIERYVAPLGSFFRVSQRREDTFVAGLSMGGYGAIKLALRHPDRFAVAASLSGALDVAGLSSGAPLPEAPGLIRRVFGDGPVAGGPDDLLALLAAADPSPCPRCRSAAAPRT